MRVRGLALALAVAVIGSAPAARAAGPYRRGFLSGYTPAGAAPVREILVSALRDLGYREGHNIVLVERYAEGRLDRLPSLARDLSVAHVDVILTQTTPAALAAKDATSTVPIVNVTSGDAVGSGLVPNLARPGGNVTGLSFLGTELAVKQLEILKQIAPGVSRIGLLANAGIQPETGFFQEMERAAPRLGVHVVFLDVRTAAEPSRVLGPGRGLRGQDPEGSAPGRPANRAADTVRAGRQRTARKSRCSSPSSTSRGSSSRASASVTSSSPTRWMRSTSAWPCRWRRPAGGW